MYSLQSITGIVLIGEIGGSMEQEVAAYLAVHPSSKPIVGLIAGGAADRKSVV